MSGELWNEAKIIGDDGERILHQILADLGCQLQKDNTDARCDLSAIIKNKSWLLETKNEINFEHTGNICIELMQFAEQKPSGLSISEATVCIHIFSSSFVLYRTNPMRLWVKSEISLDHYKVRPFPGSDNSNRGIIVPIEKIKQEPWFSKCEHKNILESQVWTWTSNYKKQIAINNLYKTSMTGQGRLFNDGQINK